MLNDSRNKDNLRAKLSEEISRLQDRLFYMRNEYREENHKSLFEKIIPAEKWESEFEELLDSVILDLGSLYIIVKDNILLKESIGQQKRCFLKEK